MAAQEKGADGEGKVNEHFTHVFATVENAPGTQSATAGQIPMAMSRKDKMGRVEIRDLQKGKLFDATLILY